MRWDLAHWPRPTQLREMKGLAQPASWPGGRSGVTIGIGYDLGYVTVDRFESDWAERLNAGIVERLTEAVGLVGLEARDHAVSLADIRIARSDAEAVFIERSIPLYEFLAAQTFPGYDRLPADAQGALVSLVFNRGCSMVDKPGEDRRKEMRAIRDAVRVGDLPRMAEQLRQMKRLCQGVDALIARREAEAQLVDALKG